MGERSFARVVRRRRDTLGLSQARLGELVGRSASTIRNWERGRSTPSDESDVRTLAAVLGVDEGSLLEEAGFPTGSGGTPVETETSPTMEQAYASLSTAELDRIMAGKDHAVPPREDEGTESEAGRPASESEQVEDGPPEPDVPAPRMYDVDELAEQSEDSSAAADEEDDLDEVAVDPRSERPAEPAEPDDDVGATAPPGDAAADQPAGMVDDVERASPHVPAEGAKAEVDDAITTDVDVDEERPAAAPDLDAVDRQTDQDPEESGRDLEEGHVTQVPTTDGAAPVRPTSPPRPWQAPIEVSPVTGAPSEEGLVGDAGVPPARDWARRPDPPDRSSELERAAPPTVLERTPQAEPSYLEDPEERQRYRMRALLTTVAVLALVIVLMWSFDRATDMLGAMWEQLTGMLSV